MILIDDNEPVDFDFLVGQTIEVQRGKFNQSPGAYLIYPDFTVINGGKVIGVNRKQAGELLGNLDAWEEQLHRELQGSVDGLVAMVEGFISPDSDGVWAWKLESDSPVVYSRRDQGNGKLSMWGRHFHYTYNAIQAKFNRMWELGIPVHFTSDIRGSSAFLIALHDLIGKSEEEHKTFNRLIKERFIISESDRAKRQFALFLMGIPGVGEEVALTLADNFKNLEELHSYMTRSMISELKLPSGRRLGLALELKIREFMGTKVEVRVMNEQ